MSGPYRDSPGGSRYVCIACYAYASGSPGLCRHCEVDLLPVDREDVRLDLHAEAERRLQKKMYGEYFKLSLLGFSLSMPLLFFVGEIGFFLGALGIGALLVKAYTKLRPMSGLALYAERRRRLELELSGQKALPAGDEDPEQLGVEETLRWLGIEGPTSRR